VGNGTLTPFDRLLSALRGMGFRDAEARKAVATVLGMHDANEAIELGQMLREAVLVATAA
jgi:Holliday junction resolvasome RuvABC DNA-binding subunit